MNFDKESKSGKKQFSAGGVGGGWGGGGVWLIRVPAAQESRSSLNINILSYIIKFQAPIL